jgi:hypothetical protein
LFREHVSATLGQGKEMEDVIGINYPQQEKEVKAEPIP